MGRKAKREIERSLAELDRSRGVTVDEYVKHVNSMGDGPSPTAREFFGRELTESEAADLWRRWLQGDLRSE